MKKFNILFLLTILLSIASTTRAFDYNGLSYKPTGEVSLLTMQPTCEVTGFASNNQDGQVIDIPADFAIDPETNTPYWPIKIAANAFKGTKAAYITSLGTVQEIGDFAFYDTRIMGSVSSITVMKVGDYAFYSCNVLTDVNFAACTEIGDHAFDGCNVLFSAVVPLVQKIGAYAFYNCTELLHFELPITLESIGRYAFAGCVDLDEVTNMSEKLLKEIPLACFQGCEDLRDFHFPDCVTKIDDYAFDGCSSLDKISIPKEVEYVGNRAFRNCKQATLVYLHGCNTKFYSGDVFAGCTAVEEVRLCRTRESVPFYILFPDSKQSIKRVRILEGSTSIGKFYENGWYQTEFGGFVNLSQVEIPEGVTMIGCMAFEGCPALKSITLPQSLDTICPRAFKESGIETLTIPDNVNYIGTSAFEHCANLKSIKWSNSLTKLPWYVCYQDSALQIVDLPASITSIGRGAFENCVSVSSISIPGKQVEWESNYFTGCPNVKKLTFVCDGQTPQITTLLKNSKNTLEQVTLLPGSTCLGTTSGNGRVYSYATLAGFGKLSKVVIPEGVTMIGYQAFDGDTMLTSISLPASIDTIGGYAFRNTNIEKIVLPKRVKFISDYTFDGCKNLQNVGFTSGLNRIGLGAFRNCAALTELKLPFSVDTIEESAFESCTGIKTITIGDKLKNLGAMAFEYCTSLEDITCYTKEVLYIQTGGYSPFHGINQEAILYVPASSLDAYKDSWYWNNNYFKDILPIGATPVETNNINIIPSECTVDIIWPVTDEAFYFVLTVYNESNEEVCQTELYYDGEVIDTHYNMPLRKQFRNVDEQDGLSYTIVGLEQGTTYTYILQTYNTNDVLIDTQSGMFTTLAAPVVEEAIHNTSVKTEGARKIIHNNCMYIVLPDGTTYTAAGMLRNL